MATTVKTDRTAARALLEQARAEGRTALTAPEGKLVCDAYGIPTPQEALVTSAKAAVDAAEKIGYPVALKIVSRDILHKTEAGGVLVGLSSAEALRSGYEQIIASARAYKKDAKVEGVQVQQMLGGGQEVIIGAVTDQSFGKLVAFGLGGVLVEVLKDVTFRLAPTSAADAESMLDSIAAAQMLKGVRGSEPVNRKALADVIKRVSELVSENPEISEVDLNPCLLYTSPSPRD